MIRDYKNASVEQSVVDYVLHFLAKEGNAGRVAQFSSLHLNGRWGSSEMFTLTKLRSRLHVNPILIYLKMAYFLVYAGKQRPKRMSIF